MSKVIFVADIHLGVTSRLQDIIWSLQVVRDYCTKHDIDTVVVLGDLYHNRESIGIDVLCESHKFFRSAMNLGHNWIVFPGNHDMFLKRSWQTNSVDQLGELITIIDDVKILQLDDRRFWILPFIYSEKAFMRVVDRIQDQYEEDDVLLTHIGVRKAIKNVCFLLQDWSVVDLGKTKFDQIFTGHFHTHQQVNDNLWYVGSIIPFKFDEGDSDHGFIVYDLESREHEFVSIWQAGKDVKAEGTPPPQFTTFIDELLDEKTASDVRNNRIRVGLTREYGTTEKEQIRTKFTDWGARRVTFFDLKYKDEPIRNDESSYTIPASRLFLKWLKRDDDNLKGYSKALLKRLNEEITQEGDEIYQRMRLEE